MKEAKNEKKERFKTKSFQDIKAIEGDGELEGYIANADLERDRLESKREELKTLARKNSENLAAVELAIKDVVQNIEYAKMVLKDNVSLSEGVKTADEMKEVFRALKEKKSIGGSEAFGGREVGVGQNQ